MSAIEPVIGWSNNQPQIAAPDNGKIASDISIDTYPRADNWVKKSNIWQATNVVLVAGLIPVNSAIRKYSKRAKWTIKLNEIENHQLPRETIKIPKAPTNNPLNNLFLETAKNIKLDEKYIAFFYKTYFKSVINIKFHYSW